MSFQQELRSWLSPPSIDIGHPINPGSKTPSEDELKLPCDDGKPAIVTFLRHCGCPFAEKTFRDMRKAADKYSNIHFIAISHSDQQATQNWLEGVGGAGKVGVVVDSDRKLYSRWGLGVPSFRHVLGPSGLLALYKLGKTENIWNRPTESGYRWQTSGTWAVDGKGLVVWGGAANGAQDVPDFQKVSQHVLDLQQQS